MAISVHSVGNVLASGTLWNNNGTISFSKPASVSSGDLLLLFLSTPLQVTSIGRPSGWVELLAPTNPSGGSMIYAAYKIAGSSEPSTYAFTNTSGQTVTMYGGAIIAYSGVDNTTPSDATPVTGSYSNMTTSALCPSITTVTNGCMIVGGLSLEGLATVSTSAMTKEWGSDTGSVLACAAGDQPQASSGASGTFTWTTSAKVGGSTATFALRPAGGGGNTYTKAGFGKEHG